MIASGGQRGPGAQALCDSLWKPHLGYDTFPLSVLDRKSDVW